MKLPSRDVFLPVGSAGLMGALPVFFYLTDFFQIEKTQFVTTGFIAIWIVIGGIGVIGKRTAIIPQRMVFLCSLGFFYFYFFNWAMWPKGSQLDELMWAYATAHAVIPFLFGSFFDQKDLRIFLKGVAFWGILLGVIVIINYIFTLSTEPGFKTSRFTVAFALNPISQSRNIGYAVLLLYAQVLIQPRKFHFPLIIALLFSLLLGGSRGPAIALVLSLVAMTYFFKFETRRNVIFLVIAAICLFVLIFLPNPVLDRYFSKDLWLEEEAGVGILPRIETVGLALDRWLEYPIFGSGTSGNRIIYYSHSIFPQILMEVGIVGLGLFFGMLFFPFWNFFRFLKKETSPQWESLAVVGLMIFGLLVAQVGGTYMTSNSIWLPMGILVAWPQIFAPEQKVASHETSLKVATQRI